MSQQVEQAVIPLVNIDEPQWDQNTYWGRAKYFFTTANPINILRTSKELDEAREIVLKYKWVDDDTYMLVVSYNMVVQTTIQKVKCLQSTVTTARNTDYEWLSKPVWLRKEI